VTEYQRGIEAVIATLEKDKAVRDASWMARTSD
jgi:hypothetical protein